MQKSEKVSRRCIGDLERGFTLIEMLVSVVIFAVIVVAVYSFFDKGQWLYLQSDKRTNIQGNARLTMEAIERDLRLAGYGVPLGAKSGGTLRWTPTIFLGNSDEIGFRADIDDGNSYLEQDATGTSINVSASNKYPDGTNLILASRGRAWFDTASTGVSSPTVTVADTIPAGAFPATSTEVYTIEEVFWHFTPGSSLPFGTVERQENHLNPQEPVGTASGTWEVMGTNIESLTFQYFNGITEMTTFPLVDADLNNISKIVVTLVAKDRSDKAQEYQTVTLKSDILVRNRRP